MKLWINLGKGFTWMFLTSLFGLLQLWLFLGHNAIVKSDIMVLDDFFINGSFMFFITAVIASISVDFFLSDLTFSRMVVGVLFVLYPVVIFGTSISVFFICLGKSTIELEIETIKTLQFTLLIMTGIYALTTKTLKFYYS